MPLYQSFPQTFVTNGSALLASGKTVDSLAVGQIGILDAKNFLAETAPTYAKNKAIYFVWGTPDITLGDFGGMPNENEYTKLIKGKLIRSFRAIPAKRGQTPVYTVGWSGDVSDTDTLFAKKGQSKNLFVKLTGAAIDRLYSKQGIVRQILTTPDCVGDCDDLCADILCPDLANQIADGVNSDKELRKFIKAKALIQCVGVTPPTETTCYKFRLNICDTGDQTALGAVQAATPNEDVSILSRNGSTTSYTVVKDVNTAPTPFIGFTDVVADCGTCPTGYTLQVDGRVFDISLPTGTSVTGINSLPGYISKGAKVITGGADHYRTVVNSTQDVVAFKAAVAAIVGGAVGTEIGLQKEKCLQTTPVSVAWVADGTLKKQTRAFRITLADDVCGNDRLADVQAAFPDNVVTLVNATGNCVHTYELTVSSNCYEVGCAIESVTFNKPLMFEGAEWKAVLPAPLDPATDCLCGVQFETAFINRTTNDCTFDAFPFENDIVHIQFSNYNFDFNADACETPWAVKQIRAAEFPTGHGQAVRKMEQESKAYDARTRSYDPVVREAQGYSLQADPNKFYDEYILEFDYRFFTSGGWSETTQETFSLHLFVPEGGGEPLEAAVNGYLLSAGIDIDPAVA